MTWNSACYWQNTRFLCFRSRIFPPAVATQSGSPTAASRSCINDGRSSSPIARHSWTCGKIYPNTTPQGGLNGYRIFHGSLGKLAGLCFINILSWAIQPHMWVQYYSEKSEDSGNFWPRSSGACGAAGAMLPARVRALANCILKPWTSSLDCCASQVITPSSSHWSSSIPCAAGHSLNLSHSAVSIHMWFLISVWSHWAGRNCWDFRLAISFCSRNIWGGWSHTICIVLTGSVSWATRLNTSCPFCNTVCLTVKSISIRFLLTIPPMWAWSSTHTRDTRSCWSDPDITLNQAHQLEPIVYINLGGNQGRGYYNNQRNPKRLSCCCCSCCLFNTRLCFYTIMFFAIASFIGVAIGKQTKIHSSILSPMLS